MALKTQIITSPLTADEAVMTVEGARLEANVWLNNLSTCVVEVPYNTSDVLGNKITLGDFIKITDEYDRFYEYVVEEIKYNSGSIELTGTELAVTAMNNQVNKLAYQNQNAVDILAGERDGPIVDPSSASTLQFTSSSTSDVDLKATIAGLGSAGNYIKEELLMKGTTTVTSSNTFEEVHYVSFSKALVGIMTITDGTNTLAKLGVGKRRVSNTDAVGTYGNGVAYKLYNKSTPTMAVKVATNFDNFNGASQQSGFTYTGSSANSTSNVTEGTHSVNIPASSTISKSIDFGTTNEIWQIEFDVYLDTLGTLTVTAGATTLATINSGAGEWQTIKLDTSGITGVQTLTFTTAAGTDVYVDSIRYMDNKYVVPYADDPLGAIQFNGENALQCIAKLANFCVVSSTNKGYDFKIKDNQDSEAWNVQKTLQLYFVPRLGSATSVITLGQDEFTNNIEYTTNTFDIVNRVTVYGGGDGVYRKVASAEDTTSINSYGVRTPENPPSFPDVNDQTVLQSIADYIIELRKDPIINLTVDPVLQTLDADIGDEVTISDRELDINFDQRITRINYTYNNLGNNFIKLQLADVQENLTIDAKQFQTTRNVLTTAQKGAVNLYMTGETQNIDASNPMDIEFFIPQDVTEINKIDLNYSVEDYRTFQGAIPEDSPVTAVVPVIFTDYSNFSTSASITRQYNFGTVPESFYSSFETQPSEIEFNLKVVNYGTTTAAFSNTNPIRMKVYNSDIGGSKTVGSSDGEVNFPVADQSIAGYGLSISAYKVRIFPTGDEYIFNGTGNYGFAVVVPYNSSVWSNGNSSGLNFYGQWSYKNFHDHDNFPIIENITKDLDALTIEISENGGAYTDVTSDLTALYGTLHTASVGASSKTTYDLSSVYTFNPDNWYTVRMTPTTTEDLWFGFENITNTVVGTNSSSSTIVAENNVFEYGTLALDPTVKTQGTYSTSWTQQATTLGFGLFKWQPNVDVDLTNKRYVLFDLYLPDTVANLDLKNLMFLLTSDDTDSNLDFDVSAGGGSRAMAAWELDISQLSSGWNTDIRMDFNNTDNSSEVLTFLGTTSLRKSIVKGIMLRGAFGDGLAADATWRIDNLRYKSGGLARIRGDIFTNFYLETGGVV